MKRYLTTVAVILLALPNINLAADKAPVNPSPVSSQSIIDPATGMEFVLVKGGCYKMGSSIGTEDEAPVHEACVDDFYLGKYEVTQGQWEKVMKNNPSEFSKCGADCPVESVSWDESQTFIKKLNSLSKKKYRLPTEAEWEYAARNGGKDEKYAGTSDETSLGDYAWFVGNSGNVTHPVGKKNANGIGLFDMTGNVDEWCQDWYANDYFKTSPKKNPAGPTMGEERASRGGAYDFSDNRARVTHRRKADTSLKEKQIGLRLLLPVK